MKNTDEYLSYVYYLWKAETITEDEYLKQVDVITDFRLWKKDINNFKFEKREDGRGQN